MDLLLNFRPEYLQIMGEELSFSLTPDLVSLIRGEGNREEVLACDALIEALFKLFFY